MGTFIDLTGMTFGDLTVLGKGEPYVSPKGYRAVNWICSCSCGNQVLVRGCNLKSGASTSCGCKRVNHPNRLTHGLSKTRIYGIWLGMKDRCSNPGSSSYQDYGGRGITIDPDWGRDFEIFLDWASSSGYQDGLSIDRIDNNKGYFPGNCRWANASTQQNNKRNNHVITFNGETHTMKEWSDITGIKYQKLKDRLNKCGWEPARALTTP